MDANGRLDNAVDILTHTLVAQRRHILGVCLLYVVLIGFVVRQKLPYASKQPHISGHHLACAR